MPITLEKVRPDGERVTRGIPSLSPEKRRHITEFELQQAYQRALQKNYRHNEEAAVAPDGERCTTDLDSQMGIPLMGAVVMARLKRLNSSLWFEPSNADSSKMGIYILRPDLQGGQEKVFICGMEREFAPEFSVRITDKEGKFKGEIRGWRTVLMKLIRKGFISEAGAFRLFGPPNRDSANWALFTQ